MNAPPPLPASTMPIRPAWGRAFGGIWRLTYRRFTGKGQLVTLAVLLAALLLLTRIIVRAGGEDAFFRWVVGFYLIAIVPIVAFVSGGGMIHDDTKPGTVDYVLTRPVRRSVFVIARFVSQLICLQVMLLVVLLGMLGVGWSYGVGDLATTIPELGLAQACTITAFLAMGYLCGAITSRYLVLGITYAGTVEMGLGHIPIQLSKLSVLRHVKAFLVERFPHAIDITVTPQGAGTTMAMVLIFVVVWLAGAAVLFSLQEFAGQRPKET